MNLCNDFSKRYPPLRRSMIKGSSISEDEKRKDSENHKKHNKYLLINVEKRKFVPQLTLTICKNRNGIE